jgi:hypothetical protein
MSEVPVPASEVRGLTHSHVCPTNEGIGNLRVERGDPYKLDSTARRFHEQEQIAFTVNRVEVAAHLVRDDSRVVATTSAKYPLPTLRPTGNAQTTKVAKPAMANLAQNAATHGLRTCPVPPPERACRLCVGRAHRAASQPAIICAGKSRRTATARSSFDKPFSSSLRPVTPSLTWKPILQMTWTSRNDWISARHPLISEKTVRGLRES